VTCAELTAYWDQAIGRFLVGGPAAPPDPRGRSWAEAYRGRGRGAVTRDALPEPYLGRWIADPSGCSWRSTPAGLGLPVVDRLGAGGRRDPTEVPSRAVLVLRGEDGPVVVAERHLGSVGPPRRSETRVLREAIEPWLGEP
jgi:hypothetical protein